MNSLKIRFLHIPKTAGSSFQHCLNRLYSAHRLLNSSFLFHGDMASDIERYYSLVKDHPDRLKVVGGHAPLITGIENVDNTPTITFLREPVARFKSFIVHIDQGKSKEINPTIAKDILQNPAAFGADNFQVRTLLGNQNYNLPELSEDDIAAMALDVLKYKLISFGITEYFEDSLLNMKRTLMWTKQPVYSHTNGRKKSCTITFSEGDIQRIKSANSIDIKLYEAAINIFKQRIAANRDYIEFQRENFRRSQNLASPAFMMLRTFRSLRDMVKN